MKTQGHLGVISWQLAQVFSALIAMVTSTCLDIVRLFRVQVHRIFGYRSRQNFCLVFSKALYHLGVQCVLDRFSLAWTSGAGNKSLTADRSCLTASRTCPWIRKTFCQRDGSFEQWIALAPKKCYVFHFTPCIENSAPSATRSNFSSCPSWSLKALCHALRCSQSSRTLDNPNRSRNIGLFSMY